MEYRRLGNSGLEVSAICLGTMTFGQQNSETEAHQQLDQAVASGVNFIDTAEMYPVPPCAETQGRTESFVGSWLKHQQRDELVVATKVTGAGRSSLNHVRGGPRVTRAQVHQAIDDSLRRLQTDYVDLYQIHWPDRYVPKFGEVYYDPDRRQEAEPIDDQLAALAELVRAGKVRYLGLSNETPYGVMAFAEAARRHDLPMVTSLQNAYHLMNRSFETGGLAEVCTELDVALLPYSPLAFGHLTGKYLDDPQAAGRITEFPNFGQRYEKTNASAATRAYVDLAREHGLSPAQMAIAFTLRRPEVASTIIGATTTAQLEENIAAGELSLSDELLSAIDEIDARYPNPTV
ncbi:MULTISPECIES: aldo/keto reductase [unclassified Guyparkeria]|uniref:aldo/keto reductase n=1 Tax=unclassified Guyparkeria TaxID=2626246 RepID=UPI00073375D6|nr:MULTISPECIES: aldo/keto reductase [unclassified Guyparkeria]KTG15892.1 aldo/keto reductase [Guyparkeria sp. XI15]OAE84642.1 aldo/keto reductase [Guyparkeria sp. WRN-7]